LAGDFSQTFRSNGKLYVIYNPYDLYETEDGSTLRRPFSGNKIPDSMKDPISLQMIKQYPAPRPGFAPGTSWTYNQVWGWTCELSDGAAFAAEEREAECALAFSGGRGEWFGAEVPGESSQKERPVRSQT
jgi:hypothetical protein